MKRIHPTVFKDADNDMDDNVNDFYHDNNTNQYMDNNDLVADNINARMKKIRISTIGSPGKMPIVSVDDLTHLDKSQNAWFPADCSRIQHKVAEKAPNKEDGIVYHTYTDLHNAALGMIPSIRMYQPDAILALDDGCVAAAIVSNELGRQTPVFSIRLNRGSTMAAEQWLDEGSAAIVRDARVIIMGLIDAGRKLLQYVVEEIQSRYNPTKIAIAVPFSKDKPKNGVLPDNIEWIFGSGAILVANTRHCFPWNSYSWEITIDEHNRKAERCTSVAAFKKKRDEMVLKKQINRRNASKKIMSNGHRENVAHVNDLPNLHNDVLGSNAIMMHLMETEK